MNKKTKIKINVLAIICIIIFGIALAPKTLQNDTFYTIKIGEHIMQNGIDRVDPFSWHDLVYTYPHWLYDVCIYLIYSVAGMAGIYISTIVLTCILGIALYITNNKVNKKPLFSFVFTIVALYMINDFLAARAQLVTYILFVLEILCIEGFLDTKKIRYAIGLPIIALLIANMHAAVFYFFFILMLPYVAEYLLIKIRDAHLIYKFRKLLIKCKIAKLTKKNKNPEKVEELQNDLAVLEEDFANFKTILQKREDNPYKLKLERRTAVKWLILIAIICFAMGLLTPIGNEPYTHIFKLMSGNTTNNISEHQPIVLVEHTKEFSIIVGLLAILIFTDTKISLKDFFMLGGLLLLSLMSRRQYSMLVIIGVMPFTKLVCNFLDKYDKNGIDEFTNMMVSWKGKIVTIALIVFFSFSIYSTKKDNEYINASTYPVDAADFILAQEEHGDLDFNTMKMYNDYNYGSYLLYRGIPVFIDSRADLYSPEFNEGKDIFSDYINISNLSTFYEDKFEEYGITHVMAYENSKLNMLLKRDENYELLYSDDRFVFYERKTVSE